MFLKQLSPIQSLTSLLLGPSIQPLANASLHTPHRFKSFSSFKIFSLKSFACVLLSIFLLYPASSFAKDYLVADKQAYYAIANKLVAGDTVLLKNGVWRDFEIVFSGFGTPEQPITLRAQDKGQVIISGTSNLRMAGEHLKVSGLVFKDGQSPTGSVIEFRLGKPQKGDIKKSVAFYSQVTEVVIDGFNKAEETDRDHWVAIHGRHNRVNNSVFKNKTNEGALLVVKLNGDYNLNNYHRIDHNYFGRRPPLGRNGAEIIRIGTSRYSLSDSYTTVENNLFEYCDGEPEVISVKSGYNTIIGNTFLHSQGSLVLRHGNHNRVENNVILGGGITDTGGIRVINSHQVVRNNYLEGVKGNRFRSAISVMNGIPNSPLNKYHQVRDSIIENNSIINSAFIEFGSGNSAKQSLAPIDSVFNNNLVASDQLITTDKSNFEFSVLASIKGIAFNNNQLININKPNDIPGFIVSNDALIRHSNGLLYPQRHQPALQKADFNVGANKELRIMQHHEVGAGWYSFKP